MKKIFFISSSEVTLNTFLKPLILDLREDYHIYTLGQENLDDINYISVPFRRKPSVFDIVTLLILIYRFKTLRPDVIVSITPKAGLLAMVAGTLTSIPVRWHIFTGQVWASKKGLYRAFLKRLDYFTYRAANNRTCDGYGQLEFLSKEWGLSKGKINVLGQGSVLGIEPQKPTIKNDFEQLQDILIVARINKDKGLEGLIKLASYCPQYNFSIAGKIEDQRLARLLQSKKNIHLIGYVNDMKDVYLNSTQLVLSLSKREGFNLSLIEAMSFGIPVIASNIYGHKGTVANGVGGFIYNEVEDIPGIIDAISMDYKSHSQRAIMWSQNFHRPKIINLYKNEFNKLLN